VATYTLRAFITSRPTFQTSSEDASTDSIPFIFLTAKASLENLRRGMNLGADDYITKPFKFEDVLASIETRLKRQQSLSLPYQKELKKLEELLEPHSQIDASNSSLIESDIQQQFDAQIRTIKRAQKMVVPLLLFELGHYLEIISSYGHTTAYGLLTRVVLRFKQVFKAQASEVSMSQIGSHHLALLLASTDQVNGITNIIHDLFATLEEAFTFNQQTIKLQGHFGVALAAQDGESWSILLNNAEIALQHALQEKQRFKYYSTSLQKQLSRRYQIENLLYSAVKKQEFELYFQPQVNIETGRVVGAEALLRWPNSTLGFISPVEFIPIAESSGSIHEIGVWVLYQACQQAQTWRLEGATDFRVAVNISPIQIFKSQLVEQIKTVLEETHLPPHCLELELTESAFVHYPDAARHTMDQLKELGIQLSIDDFGTGYAGLSYLQSFPFDTLKIDRCFIHKIMEDVDSLAIVETIAKLAQKLELDVIAEGVEHVEELAILQQYGCDTVQGYLFSAPCNAEEFQPFIQPDFSFGSSI
ncbi:MAG: EAL domain-containing protein, partial [Cyanobacteria bacterium]|nr:EAL domain-containing protein [Cyanobacteriota bacterium]MDA0866344.1 EAL domain-containing protein [Cyanobacteriota bacterium]